MAGNLLHQPGIELCVFSQKPVGRSYFLDALPQRSLQPLNTGLNFFRAEDSLFIQILEIRRYLRRVENIAHLVNAEIRQDCGQFFLEDFLHPVFNSVLQDEVECPDNVFLADAVHSADALLQAHGVPRQVVIDDHVAKLQIQALAAGIGGYKHPGGTGKFLLDPPPFFQPHGPV